MLRIACLSRSWMLSMLGIAALLPTASSAALCDGISTASNVPLTTVRVASGLTRPVLVTSPPGDVTRLFIVLQDGQIQILKNGAILATPFLDINALTRSPLDAGAAANEEGLLGLAFAPDYATSGRFFIYHTDTTGANNLLVRYTRSTSDPDLADTTTRQLVLTFPHPTNTNHNGGMIAFAPDDGYLYVGTGDGGGSCDAPGNAQNLSSLLGKMHRLDVSGATYTIPPDNPFVGVVGARGEIWFYGLRNPWRWSFDRLTADLYIGDVGQNKWEEVDYSPASSPGGANYGWDHYEGDSCPNASCGDEGTCALPSYAPPVLVYDQTLPSYCAVTGGYVYRGCRMPGLSGTYFYADYCAATIKTFKIVGGVATSQVDRTAELAPGGGLAISLITSFGEDARGEVYIVDASSGAGEVYKIVPVLANLEVSGVGATQFELGPASWNWEDLQATSSHPITSYNVYRQTDNAGSFVCVHQGATTSWSGGDPAVPAEGSWFSYLVVGRTAAGQQSSPGTGTGGLPRTLDPAPCPP